ncbi:P-loop containing nucleoside triphosphate hydrolase protein [Phellopilus nigrolimitatus]|nr:P-loop containing nucleoside triphosphate hydrolase protein [Phellopilus nigrolimitatus]
MVTDITTTKYAERARALMGAAQKLRDIGAQAFVDIPRIAVIGGQSAGKSSLVEAVSGIRVPRDSGTCTRCPMEINLINTPGQWSCRITLRFEYDSSGIPLTEVQSVPFGLPFASRDDVELALRRAQTAVLNHPKMNTEFFILKSRDELEYYRTYEAFDSGTLKFSKNTVVVDIFDEKCANLSFVDLPGLIQNDEQSTVQLVEDLVRSNIEGNCLILVTIPMSDDIENQRAMRIALEVDTEKTRTIGVLTKPDTLTAGALNARKKWKDLMAGNDKSIEPHALKLGYYCVKLADDAERATNPSREERNASETMFFSTTLPWSTIPDRKLFGVSNLVNDLSRYLTEILESILPRLGEQAREQLKSCRDSLAQLPELLHGDVSSEVLERVTNFCQELTATVYGYEYILGVQHAGPNISSNKSFIQSNRAMYKGFRSQIRHTAPDFRPFENHQDYTKPSFADLDGSSSHEGQGNGPRDLLYVRKVIKESIAWELPNNVPFDAKRRLIEEFVCEWDGPALKCFEDVSTHLSSCLDDILRRHFERFSRLKNHIGTFVKDLFSVQKKIARSAIDSALNLEKNPLFTQNEHYLSRLQDKWLAEYSEIRRNQTKYLKTCGALSETHYSTAASPVMGVYEMPRIDPPSVRAIRALAEMGYPGLSEIYIRLRMRVLDEFNEELIVMADVRAYFFVAYKRIIDSVPLTIEHMLNQGLADCMKKSLLQKLDLGAPDATRRLKDLLAEDPDIARRRRELTAKIERLEKIQAELRTWLT